MPRLAGCDLILHWESLSLIPRPSLFCSSVYVRHNTRKQKSGDIHSSASLLLLYIMPNANRRTNGGGLG